MYTHKTSTMKFFLGLTLVLAMSGSICEVNSSKILFFFTGGTYSHKVSVWPFVTALANRGHNVTFFSPFNKSPFDHPQVRDFAPKLMTDWMMKQFGNVDRLSERLRSEETRVWTYYNRDQLEACKATLSAVKVDEDMRKLFYEDKFDLIINNVIFGDCGYILAHHLMQGGAKLILFNSGSLVPWFYDAFGYPSATAWIPEGGQKVKFPMSFWDRLNNYFVPLYWHLRREWEIMWPLEKLMRDVYKLDEYPSLRDVERNASLIFVATHHGTDFPRAIPPFIINTGGMQCWQKEKPLDAEFQAYLDDATHGAVLIAFGSTIDLSKIPKFFQDIFFDTIRKFPDVQFIWRWDGPLPENHPKNLKVAKWLPQYQILGHPNLKAFVSHAGLNSLTEATCQGVPVILLPLFADQDYNGYRVEAYEIGMRLEARTLSLDVMEKALRNVLTDDKYSKNMKKLSAIMKDRPMNPVDTAVYWTEFVLRHENTDALKPQNYLPWYQRRMWDVLAVLTFLGANLILIVYALLKIAFTRTKKEKPEALVKTSATSDRSTTVSKQAAARTGNKAESVLTAKAESQEATRAENTGQAITTAKNKSKDAPKTQKKVQSILADKTKSQNAPGTQKKVQSIPTTQTDILDEPPTQPKKRRAKRD